MLKLLMTNASHDAMKKIVKLFSTSTINNAGFETGNTTLWEFSITLTADPSLPLKNYKSEVPAKYFNEQNLKIYC